MYKTYIDTYLEETKKIAESVDKEAIHQAIELLKDVRDRNGRLFILGIGGSASNASHAVNDFRKMCRIETYAPTDNVGELTAWTNDNGFDVIFKHWLEGSRLKADDAVLVFSVGGGSEHTSKNIVHALQYAKHAGAKILGIVSRDGGATKRLADVAILVPVVHEKRITPHAEGWQGVLWHLMANALADHHRVPPYGWEHNKHRAVFIDRDGVVNKPVWREGYEKPTAPWSLNEFCLYENISDALKLLKQNGFLSVLVTNQPDVSYGNMKAGEFKKIMREVEKLPFDDIYFCHHTREHECVCKKPKPGMLLRAKDIWGIDLPNSFMIGDTESDTGAGEAVGCKTVLIDAPYNKDVQSNFRVKNLLAAVELIVNNS